MRFKDIATRTGVAFVVAAVGNLVLLGTGRAIGISMVVPHGPEKIKQVMDPTDILVAQAILLGLGALAYLAMVKLTRQPERWWRMLAVVGFIALLFPLGQEMDNATRVVLLLMHVVAAGALLWSLARKPAPAVVLA